MKRTKELQELKAIWDQKLRESGFEDIEDDRERLKQHDERTISFSSQEQVREFFHSLDEYLNSPKARRIPRFERLILTLYSCGIPQVQIAERTLCSYRWVKKVIRRHKTLLGF